MKSVKKYDIFQWSLPSEKKEKDTLCPKGIFWMEQEEKTVEGFFENAKEAVVRFMPEREGLWKYRICWDEYVDEGELVIQETLKTLETAPFNKIRMCLFPKSMPFNQNDPQFYPFEKREDGSWDPKKPDQRYWEHLENCIRKLGKQDIQADLILFHPYDRWGFSTMPHEDNLAYVSYAVRRLSAFANIWWSLANEYEFSVEKEPEHWNDFGKYIAREDPYGHLIGIHNWIVPYPKQKWMTHVSFQGIVTECPELRKKYGIPVIVDECNYEGDIDAVWGNLSGFEMINRMWYCVASGCYATHGETFYQEDEVLWWAKGGRLHGKSPERIAFLRKVLESLPGPLELEESKPPTDPNGMGKQGKLLRKMQKIIAELPGGQLPKEMRETSSCSEDARLIYLSRMCQSYYNLCLPQNGSYRVEIIDIWEMTHTTVLEEACGEVRLLLPGKEGTAILVLRTWGDSLRQQL